MDSRWYLEQGAHRIAFANKLEITFIDTPPFIKKYRKQAWANLIGEEVQFYVFSRNPLRGYLAASLLS